MFAGHGSESPTDSTNKWGWEVDEGSPRPFLSGSFLSESRPHVSHHHYFVVSEQTGINYVTETVGFPCTSRV